MTRLSKIIFLLATFQLALLGIIIEENSLREALTLPYLQTLSNTRSLQIGDKFPAIAVYNQDGKALRLFDRKNEQQTFLFSSCSCDLPDTSLRAHQAVSHGDQVTIILVTSPYRIKEYTQRYNLPGRVVAMRVADLPSLRHTKPPCMVLAQPNGTIYALPTFDRY